MEREGGEIERNRTKSNGDDLSGGLFRTFAGSINWIDELVEPSEATMHQNPENSQAPIEMY